MTEGTPAMSWSLRDVIVEALDAADDPNPEAVVDEVVAAIPNHLRTAVLKQLMPYEIRHVIRAERSTPLPDDEDVAPVRRGESKSQRHELAARRMWRALFWTPEFDWQRLEDMTADSWQAYADYHRATAKAHDLKADMGDQMVATLAAAKAARTGDLPFETVKAVLGL